MPRATSIAKEAMGNGNGWQKILGACVLVAALLAAIVRPMDMAINQVRGDLAAHKQSVAELIKASAVETKQHSLIESHLGTVHQLAAIHERLKRIETQFFGLSVNLNTWRQHVSTIYRQLWLRVYLEPLDEPAWFPVFGQDNPTNNHQ